MRHARLRKHATVRKRDKVAAFLDKVVSAIRESDTPFGDFAKDVGGGKVQLITNSNGNLVPLPNAI